ncbi:MAG: hypothetical protein GX352_01845 [Clostridiales bacterium]|nr:hypothetical protein [Clostridiales bacterium]
MYYNTAPENDIAVFTQIIKDEIKNEIIKELYIQQRYNQVFGVYKGGIGIPSGQAGYQPGRDSYTQEAADTPLEGVYTVNNPGQTTWNHSRQGVHKKTDIPADTQRNNLLYGVGMVALMGVFLPNFRQKIISVVGNTASEGAGLIEKARFMIAKAKEDMEDLIAEASFNNSSKKS